MPLEKKETVIEILDFINTNNKIIKIKSQNGKIK